MATLRRSSNARRELGMRTRRVFTQVTSGSRSGALDISSSIARFDESPERLTRHRAGGTLVQVGPKPRRCSCVRVEFVEFEAAERKGREGRVPGAGESPAQGDERLFGLAVRPRVTGDVGEQRERL